MTQQVRSLGFSPCPNDTYIFYAFTHRKIPSLPFSLRPVIAGVEALNTMAREGCLDISKISLGSYPYLWDRYVMLTAGGAISYGNGPLIVAKRPYSLQEIAPLTLAVPGYSTTANMLLDIFELHQGPRKEMLFSDIMPSICDGTVDAGVVIHEGRWTYHTYGLTKVADLGEMWETMYGLPLPLGVIVMRRDHMKGGIASLVNDAIRASIVYAREHREEVWHFIVQHASEMADEIIERHISAFVNTFSEEMETQGKEAVRRFLEALSWVRKTPFTPLPLFWDEERGGLTL